MAYLGRRECADHGRWDGKFHRLSVEVKKPGAHLFYRRGYFAASTSPIEQAARQQLLKNNLAGPLDATVLGLTARAAMTAIEGRKFVRIQVLFSPRDISFVPAASGWSGAVDLMFVEQSDKGKVLVSSKGTLDLSVTDEQKRTQQEKPFAFSHHIELLPGAHSIRIVALDAMSGALGSLTIPLSEVQ